MRKARLSLVHLRNIVAATEAGGACSAGAGLLREAQTLNDVVAGHHQVAEVLDLFEP